MVLEPTVPFGACWLLQLQTAQQPTEFDSTVPKHDGTKGSTKPMLAGTHRNLRRKLIRCLAKMLFLHVVLAFPFVCLVLCMFLLFPVFSRHVHSFLPSYIFFLISFLLCNVGFHFRHFLVTSSDMGHTTMVLGRRGSATSPVTSHVRQVAAVKIRDTRKGGFYFDLVSRQDGYIKRQNQNCQVIRASQIGRVTCLLLNLVYMMLTVFMKNANQFLGPIQPHKLESHQAFNTNQHI